MPQINHNFCHFKANLTIKARNISRVCSEILNTSVIRHEHSGLLPVINSIRLCTLWAQPKVKPNEAGARGSKTEVEFSEALFVTTPYPLL